MFEKFDDFFGRYMEKVDSGKDAVGEFIGNSLNGVIQLLLAVLGVLVIIASLPLWVIGKLSTQQSVYSDAGESAASTDIVQASAESTSQTEPTSTQRG